jgi:isopentenyl-diphosphate Delta-isomerase
MDSSFEDFENRKKDHIRLALDNSTQGLVSSGFSKIRLMHQALPEINFSDVSLKVKLLNAEFSSPHFVSSMTAGHKDSGQINLNLAKAAATNNWLMAVGSQRRELTDSAASLEWKKIKAEVPNLHLVSNIGILELLSCPMAEILKLAENLEASALYVHLNPLQEVFQNNQNINFTGALKAIENLVKQSRIPILVKEVGFGINKDLTRKLFEVGVLAVDVSGHGGTHWGQIEALRQPQESIIYKISEAFHDWGQSTVDCLLGLQDQNLFSQIWASGGIRSGVDSAKCLALGARAVGIAQPLMRAAVESEELTSELMKQFDYQLRVAMFCSGVKKCEDFLHKKVWYGPDN